MINLNTYINYLKSEKKSENTIKNYVRHVTACLEAIGKEVDAITYADMIDWRGALVESGLSANSINLMISAVKNYFNFLVDMEMISKNPVAKLGILKSNPKVKPFITIDDIKAMLSQNINAKSKAIIAFLASTGMRISELRSITKKQWDEACQYNGQINIVGKGDKPRAIFVSDNVKHYVADYIAKFNPTDSNLFGNIDEANICKMLKNCAKNAGLSYWEDMSPHCLRAAFATIQSELGTPIEVVSKMMGHSSVTITSRVYTKISTERMADAFTKEVL